MSLKLCQKCKALFIDFGNCDKNICFECEFNENLKQQFNKENLKEVNKIDNK